MSYLFENYARYDIAFTKGSGPYLYDNNGKRYLDFGCGISVTNLGHAHPYLAERLKEQADRLWHTSNLYHNELQQSLGARIANGGFGGKLFFCNSGAEANETAIKLARIYNNKRCGGGKPRIITMKNGFHGRTYATLSATAQAKVQAGFEPIAPFFTYLELNDIASLKSELAKGDVGAVMLELFQGESGVLPADEKYVTELCSEARKVGALVIFDEVQTGFGRTGKLFAYQHYNEAPDIMTMAKGIANGMPMGAVAAKSEIADLFTPGTHGTTFGGGFLVCAVAHAVLDLLLADGFLDEVDRKGKLMRDMLAAAFAGDNINIRGKGLMVGMQLDVDVKEFIKEGLAEGIVVIPGGCDAIRVYPPLNISDKDLEQGIAMLKKVYDRVKK